MHTFLESVRSDRLYCLFLLAFTSGMRRGELLGLRGATWTLIHASSPRSRQLSQSVITFKSPSQRLHDLDGRSRLATLPCRRCVSKKGTRIRLYVADLDVRIVTFDGTLLRQLTLDPTRRYQPSGLPRFRVREGSGVPR